MSKRADALARILKDLAQAQPGLPDAVARVQDQRRGFPGAASYDRAGGRSSGTPDPTGQAIAGTASKRTPLGRPDPARAELAAFDVILNRMEADALAALRFVQSNTPHVASPKDRAQVERVNDPTPECAITRDLIGEHEPMHRTSDCGGVLPAAMPLGRWVYDFIRTKGRKPTVDELTRHHRMLPVRVGA